jgi:hypothetical protein
VNRIWRPAGVFVTALAAGLLFARARLDSYDAGIMLQVAQSIVTAHDFRVHSDYFNLNLPYASYGIGMSLLMLPPVLLAPVLHRPVESLVMLLNPAIIAATALTLWAWARAAGWGPRVAAVVALVTVGATPLLSYSSTAFVEPATALGVAIGLLGVELARRRVVLGPLLAGAGSAAAVLMRADSLVLIVPFMGLAAAMRSRRPVAVLPFALALAPSVALVAAYNAIRFGSPLVGQYQRMPLTQAFDHPWLVGVYGLTLSPGRGLLLFTPLVILAGAGAVWAWRRSAVMTLLCVSLLLARVAFYAGWYAWYGGSGWGPRFLVPALPALAPLVVEVLVRLPSATSVVRVAAVGVVAAGLALAVLGAGVDYAAESFQKDSWEQTRGLMQPDLRVFAAVAPTRPYEDAVDGLLLDWRRQPIVEHAELLARGQALTSRWMEPPGHLRSVALLGIAAVLGLLASLWRRGRGAEGAGQPAPGWTRPVS